MERDYFDVNDEHFLLTLRLNWLIIFEQNVFLKITVFTSYVVSSHSKHITFKNVYNLSTLFEPIQVYGVQLKRTVKLFI